LIVAARAIESAMRSPKLLFASTFTATYRYDVDIPHPRRAKSSRRDAAFVF
jgi:hypothetical protein